MAARDVEPDGYPPYRWLDTHLARVPPFADLAGLASDILARRIVDGRRRGLRFEDHQWPWENPQGTRAVVRVMFTNTVDHEIDEVLFVATAGEQAPALLEACKAVRLAPPAEPAEPRRAAA